MTRKRILIIIGVLIVACLLCVVVAVLTTGGAIFAVFNTVKPLTDTSNDFMTALRDGNYGKAYDLCGPDLQKEVGGSADGLQQMIVSGNVKPASWNFNSFNMSGSNGQVGGDVTFTGNRPGTASIVLAQVGGQWKIVGFNLKEK